MQTIGGTRSTLFNNLTIDKPGGTGEVRQLLDSGTDNLGVLNLTNDFVNTQTFIFAVGNTAQDAITRTGAIVSTGGYPNVVGSATTEGYVTSTVGSAGRLSRVTLIGTEYFFPVGTSARFRPVSITPTAGAVNAYSVLFQDVATPSTGSKDPTLATINPAWYHKMNRQVVVGGAATENIRIFSDFVADDVCDEANATMSEWDGALWRDLSPATTLNPGAPFLSHTTKAGYPAAYATPWVTEDFALAGLFIVPGTMSCVFPTEGTPLRATAMGDHILLDWSTLTESNNAGWDIERSTDGHSFSYLNWQSGAINSSSPISYTYPDRDVIYNQVYYYRLKQKDLDGQYKYSNIVQAILLEDGQLFISGFYPNPSQGNTGINVTTTEEMTLNFDVVNTLGQEVYSKKFELPKGETTLNFNFNELAAGTYYARITNGKTFIKTEKIVIE